MQLLDGCRSPRQQFVHTQLVFAGIIFSGNHKTLLLVFIRTIRSNCMSDDITLRIKAEIIRSIKYEFVAHLCLGESQQLIDIQLIFSGLRTGLYDRKALVLCFIRILGSDRMSDDVALCIKAEIIRSIKYEFVAHLCLGESQQLIDIQLIFSGLRTGLYDRKALVLCFIRILGSDRMSDDIAIRIKGKIFSYQQTTK